MFLLFSLKKFKLDTFIVYKQNIFKHVTIIHRTKITSIKIENRNFYIKKFLYFNYSLNLTIY